MNPTEDFDLLSKDKPQIFHKYSIEVRTEFKIVRSGKMWPSPNPNWKNFEFC